MNEGVDGTLQWVQEQGLDYTYSPQNVGVCMSMNMMRSKVRTDYICFLNDDMYVLPHWDEVLVQEIESLPDNRFFLSSTTIQPHTPSGSIIVADFGDTIASFQEKALLDHYQDYPLNDWMGATMPPNVVHRDIWDLVGGYSVEYSPGMYSDPDFSAKLWHAGVRLFKGVNKSRVYHFEARSTQRIVKNDGSTQFLRKWGITSASFMRDVLHRGVPFDQEDDTAGQLKKDLTRSRWKLLLTALRDTKVKHIWE